MAYEQGTYNVRCDKCGRKRKAYECRMNHENLYVCSDTCWEPKHPQEFVTSKDEKQTVPIARPDVPQTMGETTIKTAASKDDTNIIITSISGISQYDEVGIKLDNGLTHWTFVTTTPAVDTIVINDFLWGDAAVGNAVYLPSINSETFI